MLVSARSPRGRRLHLIVELGVHLGVHLVDDIDGGRVVDQEEADLLQALLLRHVLPLGERFQEVGLVGGRVERCLEVGERGGEEGATLVGGPWEASRGPGCGKERKVPSLPPREPREGPRPGEGRTDGRTDRAGCSCSLDLLSGSLPVGPCCALARV